MGHTKALKRPIFGLFIWCAASTAAFFLSMDEDTTGIVSESNYWIEFPTNEFILRKLFFGFESLQPLLLAAGLIGEDDDLH